MSRRNQRRDNPIEHVRLRITLRARKDTASQVRERIPGVKVKKGSIELIIEGKSPSEVVEKAKASLDMARKSMERPEAFK
jgi:di/tripeptidase